MNRLFVPLSKEPYEWFASGRKRWELRRSERQFSQKHLMPGRDVELRRGYSDKHSALWGEIISVIWCASLDEVFSKVKFEELIPVAKSSDEAKAIARAILGSREKESSGFVAFCVRTAPGSTGSYSEGDVHDHDQLQLPLSQPNH